MSEPVYKRRCTGPCQRILPMTAEHFYRTNESPYFRSECIDCNLDARKGRDRYKPDNETAKLRQRARKRAAKRLRNMYPVLWHKLLSEEYSQEGLEPPAKVLADEKGGRT